MRRSTGSAGSDYLRQRAAVRRQGFEAFIRMSGMTHVRTSPFYSREIER
jgi:hypothetical protein